MRTFRPVDQPSAHRVFRRKGQTAFDDVVVAAYFVCRFVCVENSENPREFAEEPPVGEVVDLVRGIGGIFKDHGAGGIKLRHKFLHLSCIPIHAEIPASDQQRCIRILFTQSADDAAVGVELHLVIGSMIRIAPALRQPDRVEQFRRTVFPDVGFSQFEVVVKISVVADIPYQPCFLVVAFGCLRHEFRLDPVQEIIRSPAVPVSHGSHVFRMEEIALSGIGENLFTEFSAVFQRPEKIAVVIRARFGFRYLVSGIVYEFRERFLEQIVEPDPQHEQIEAFLENPVDFPFPLVKIPVFRLETVQAPVREITQTPVFETGAFEDVDFLNADCLLRGDDITVPEITAVRFGFKKVINSIEKCAGAPARDEKQAPAVVLSGDQLVIVRIGPYFKLRNDFFDDLAVREGVDRIGTHYDKVAFAVVLCCDGELFTGGFPPDCREFLRRDSADAFVFRN